MAECAAGTSIVQSGCLVVVVRTADEHGYRIANSGLLAHTVCLHNWDGLGA